MIGPNDREDDPAAKSSEAPLIEIDTEPEPTERTDLQEDSESTTAESANRRTDWSRVLAYGLLPGLALSLALVAGFSKWQESSARSSQIACTESLAAAKESTIALLSYQPDSVEQSLVAARDRLTSPYKDAYTELTNDVVIPGARHDHVSVTATVPAAASVSATAQHAVAILFVNQAAAIGTSPPINTESSIRVTLQKIGGRWLISGFDPI